MTARPPQPPPAALPATPIDAGEPFTVGVARYRTAHELAFYLRAFDHVRAGRTLVVLGLPAGGAVPAAELPATVRLILTAPAGAAVPSSPVGWAVPDPFRAVLLALTGRQPDEAVTLLFPADWPGDGPDALVEKARRWRRGPHSPNDDVFFNAD